MSEYILIIDEIDKIKALVDRVLLDTSVKVLACKDVNSAKRKLVQAIPCAILSMVNVDGDAVAGINLCRQLREHGEFSKIPVVLFSEHISSDMLQSAHSEGAKAVVPLTVPVIEFHKFLNNLLPDIVAKPIEVKTVIKPAAQATVGTAVIDPVTQEKIEIAQRLMAKVLHNLKTSDLLQVVDKDEVAQVVYEMTRSVCGISSNTVSEATIVARGCNIDHKGIDTKCVDIKCVDTKDADIENTDINLDKIFSK